MTLAVILTLLEGIITKSPTVISDVKATMTQVGADTGVLAKIKDILTGALKVLTDLGV